MTFETLPLTLSPLLPDLMFLARECRGPDFAKSQITGWVAQVADANDEAWTLDALKETCTALVVLAHANAGFRRVDTPFGYRGPAVIDIDDRFIFIIKRGDMHRLSFLYSSLDVC